MAKAQSVNLFDIWILEFGIRTHFGAIRLLGY
jgi:hypothetical protein